MYVIGGLFSGEILDTLQIFNGQSWTVSEVRRHGLLYYCVPQLECLSQSRLLTPRVGACALPYSADYLVLVGGARSLVTPDTALEVYSVTRDRWKALRVQNSFTGSFTASCVLSEDDGGVVTVFGGINAEDMRRPVMDGDLHRLRLQCGAGDCHNLPLDLLR